MKQPIWLKRKDRKLLYGLRNTPKCPSAFTKINKQLRKERKPLYGSRNTPKYPSAFTKITSNLPISLSESWDGSFFPLRNFAGEERSNSCSDSYLNDEK